MSKIKKKITLLLKIKILEKAGPPYLKESPFVPKKLGKPSRYNKKIKKSMSDEKIREVEQKHRNKIESLRKKYHEI